MSRAERSITSAAFGPGLDPASQNVVRQVLARFGAALTAPGGGPAALAVSVDARPLDPAVLGQCLPDVGGYAITINAGARWHTDFATGPPPGAYDLRSVIEHEVCHALGVGTDPRWFEQVRGGAFVGPRAQGVYGGPVPLGAGGMHWAEGLTVGGRRAAMDPTTPLGARVTLAPLDVAALEDMGYAVRPGVLVDAVPAPAVPFPGYGGAVQWARGDVTGDGIADWVAAPVRGSHVKVFDGATGAEVLSLLTYPGYTGAIALAVLDVNGDGRADILTSAAANGHIKAFDGRTGELLLSALPPG